MSYTCGPSMKKLIANKPKPPSTPSCSCRDKNKCPLDHNCSMESVVYESHYKNNRK